MQTGCGWHVNPDGKLPRRVRPPMSRCIDSGSSVAGHSSGNRDRRSQNRNWDNVPVEGRVQRWLPLPWSQFSTRSSDTRQCMDNPRIRFSDCSSAGKKVSIRSCCKVASWGLPNVVTMLNRLTSKSSRASSMVRKGKARLDGFSADIPATSG